MKTCNHCHKTRIEPEDGTVGMNPNAMCNCCPQCYPLGGEPTPHNDTLTPNKNPKEPIIVRNGPGSAGLSFKDPKDWEEKLDKLLATYQTSGSIEDEDFSPVYYFDDRADYLSFQRELKSLISGVAQEAKRDACERIENIIGLTQIVVKIDGINVPVVEVSELNKNLAQLKDKEKDVS